MFVGGGLCASEEESYGFNVDSIRDMLQKSGDLYTGKGKSKSIRTQHVVAVAHFDLMAEKISAGGQKIPNFHEAPASLFCSVEIYQRYAHYLNSEAYCKILKDKEALDAAGEDLDTLFDNSDVERVPLLLSSILQYFSNFLQETIQVKGPGCEDEFMKELVRNPKGESVPWVSDIRLGLKKEFMRNCQENGILIDQKCRGINIENLILVIKNIRSNKSNSRSEILMQIAQVVMQFMSAGRASEVALVRWSFTSWNFDEQLLEVTWFESKTCSQKMMAFSNHRTSYDLCLFFSLFMYMITNGRGFSSAFEDQTIFPALTPQNAAATISKSLRSGLAGIQGLQRDLSSKDLRYAAANLMLLNAGIEVCVALGGWGIDTMTARSTGSMYIYIMVLFTLICQGARVLCAFASYKKANAAPSLSSVNRILGPTDVVRLKNMFEFCEVPIC